MANDTNGNQPEFVQVENKVQWQEKYVTETRLTGELAPYEGSGVIHRGMGAIVDRLMDMRGHYMQWIRYRRVMLT